MTAGGAAGRRSSLPQLDSITATAHKSTNITLIFFILYVFLCYQKNINILHKKSSKTKAWKTGVQEYILTSSSQIDLYLIYTIVHYRTLIISDLHLGAPDAKYKQLTEFLEKHTFDNLILNGDIIDGLYLKFFNARKPAYTKLLEKIIALTQHNCKITYLLWNHDHNRHKKIALNRDAIEIKINMLYKSGDKTYFIAHGQQLDGKTPKWLENIGFLCGVFVYWLNRIYNKRRREQRFGYQSIVSKLKDLAKFIMVGNPNKVHDKIKQICIKQKVDGFICGHLHHPVDIFIDKFHYLNSWDRVESMTALAETPDHQWSILYYE